MTAYGYPETWAPTANAVGARCITVIAKRAASDARRPLEITLL